MAAIATATLVKDYADLTAQIKELEAQKKELSVKLVARLEGKPKQTFVVDEQRYSATFVQASSIVVDAAKLKSRLETTEWTKISTRTLDQAKLEVAIRDEIVDPLVVSECSKEVKRAPYVKVAK